MDEAIRSLAKQLGAAAESEAILRQGIVTAVAADGTASVKWGNNATASPSQRCLASYMPLVGDTVWGVRDGDVTIVLGPVAAPWVDVGVGAAPAFQNSWVNYGGGYQAAGYSKTGDMVHLRGSIKSGTMTATAFTLPVGFRPPTQVIFSVYSYAAAQVLGAVYVTTGGLVVPLFGGNTHFSLDGVSFHAGS